VEFFNDRQRAKDEQERAVKRRIGDSSNSHCRIYLALQSSDKIEKGKKSQKNRSSATFRIVF
jgi:hypothetical protein